MPKVKLKLASESGRFIVSEGLENGVDFALSQKLPLDHAEVVPLSYITISYAHASPPPEAHRTGLQLLSSKGTLMPSWLKGHGHKGTVGCSGKAQGGKAFCFLPCLC
jgi:hypothetical protein